MMDIGQFAVYQLKNIPENREIRFRPYEALREMGVQVRCEYYEQVCLGWMWRSDTPESIRERLDRQQPRTFKGHYISVSDVLVLNESDAVTSYYVEKNGFTVITGFIWSGSSNALVSLDTKEFHITGKEGRWLAFDSILMNGKEFFLMEHEKYGKEAAWAVVDENGKLIMDRACHGFDQPVLQKIKDYLNEGKNHLEKGGDMVRTAEMQHCHRNTVRYRLMKIREALGLMDVTEMEFYLQLKTAVRIHQACRVLREER